MQGNQLAPGGKNVVARGAMTADGGLEAVRVWVGKDGSTPPQ